MYVYSVYKFVLARPGEFLPFHSCTVIPVIVADHHVEVVDVSGRHRNGDLGPPGHAQPGALLVPPVSAVFLVQFATPFARLEVVIIKIDCMRCLDRLSNLAGVEAGDDEAAAVGCGEEGYFGRHLARPQARLVLL